MDYRRYAIGSYARLKWIECTECGKPDKPLYVWQSEERAANMAFPVNAIMKHELSAHASKPAIKRKS